MKVLRNIKSVLKIVLIILIVAAVIAGTCFLFFRFLKREENSYANVSEYIYSSERNEFTARINFVKEKQVNEDNKQRFSIAASANQTLNEIAQSLIPYMNSYKLNNKTIMNKYRALIKQQSQLSTALSTFEYNVMDLNFDEDIGSNDIIVHYGNYLAKYADMLKEINNQISSNVPNKNINVLFYIDDLYFRVVQTSTERLKRINQFVQFENSDNLQAFEDFIASGKFNNYVNTNIQVNYFIEAYNKLDKQAFATNLKQNLDKAETITGTSSNEEKAAFYLKQMLAKEV